MTGRNDVSCSEQLATGAGVVLPRMSVVYAVRKRKQLGGIVHAEIYILYGDETNKAKKMDHEKC